MDRAPLEQMLADGLSLAEIGRQVDRHEATVSYWMKKYNLRSVHRAKYAARGGIGREQLEDLVNSGLSIAAIAEATSLSKATVRHWLTRYGLKTHGALGRRPRVKATQARAAGLERTTMECKHHGQTAFVLDCRGYYRCGRCRSAAVARRRRRVKELLVAEAGGACCVCGYDRNVRALHFHHLDPSSKRLEINARGAGIALERLQAEVQKCVLVCANCHAKVEAGLIELPTPDRAPYNPTAPVCAG
jgi:transposase